MEVDQACTEDAVDSEDFLQQFFGDVVVDRQHHDIRAFFVRPADLHAGDVDAVLAQILSNIKLKVIF